jgi:ubiquinone/menaquinone biosynthesis C-methylase UbiE
MPFMTRQRYGVTAFFRALMWAPFLCSTISLHGLASVTHAQEQHEGHHRRPDDITSYLEQLDRPERAKEQKPAEVVAALGLKPGMSVADVGSGSGFFTRRFVEAVTESGTVYAVDIEPEMLQYAKESVEHLHVPSTAEFILAAPDNPKLPAASVDVIFLCNTYHHLEDRAAYFARVKTALKPGGRIAIIDFYHDERSGNVGFPRRHLVPQDTVIAEMSQAGYRLVKEHTFLDRQYFVEFVPHER